MLLRKGNTSMQQKRGPDTRCYCGTPLHICAPAFLPVNYCMCWCPHGPLVSAGLPGRNAVSSRTHHEHHVFRPARSCCGPKQHAWSTLGHMMKLRELQTSAIHPPINPTTDSWCMVAAARMPEDASVCRSLKLQLAANSTHQDRVQVLPSDEAVGALIDFGAYVLLVPDDWGACCLEYALHCVCYLWADAISWEQCGCVIHSRRAMIVSKVLGNGCCIACWKACIPQGGRD